MNKYTRAAQAEWRNEKDNELAGKIEMAILCVSLILCGVIF